MPPVYTQAQVLIVGGGPGGYVAAIRAAQLGLKVTLVEAVALGGSCLNVGCIPSKALIHAADAFAQASAQAQGQSALGIKSSGLSLDLATTLGWKDGIVAKLTGGVAALLKKHGVTVIKGWAQLIDGKTVEIHQPGGDAADAPQRIQCEHLVLAAGSQEVELPFLPFSSSSGSGQARVVSSTEALSFSEVPRRLVVVGAGYIGLELGTAWRKLGAEVCVVEALDRVLPAYDSELVKPVAQSLARLGIDVRLGHRVEGLNAAGDALTVRDPQGALIELPADKVLVAVGRRPRLKGWGLERLMLDMNGSAVKIDAQCRTSMKQVWAIGDLAGEPLLAHRAMAQGEMVAELIAGHSRRFEPASIPAVCFTDPEIVVVGHTPASAQALGLEIIQASFPFAANGRALSLQATEGFVRVLARADNHLILGWQAVGAAVSELSAAFGLSLEMGARLEDVAHTIHAHPTLGEAVQEAALRALGQALHIA